MKKDENGKVKFYSEEIKVKQIKNEDYTKVRSLIIIFIIMGILLGGLFYVNAKYITKDMFQGEETTTTKKVEYDDTLLTVDNMFNQKGTYYVLAYDAKDKQSSSFYTSLINNFKEDKISLYSIDLSNKMNNKYYDTKKKESIVKDKINFVKGTLVTIKDGNVDSYTTDITKIAELLSVKEEK